MNIFESDLSPSDADMEWYLSTTYVDPAERADVLPADPWACLYVDVNDPVAYRAALDEAIDAARNEYRVDDYHEGLNDSFDYGMSDYLSDKLAGRSL